MSFRTDKTRGAHPITPKKGIKEVDMTIKEKGVNDTIKVSVKPGNNSYEKRDLYGVSQAEQEIFGEHIPIVKQYRLLSKKYNDAFQYAMKHHNDKEAMTKLDNSFKELQEFQNNNLVPLNTKNHPKSHFYEETDPKKLREGGYKYLISDEHYTPETAFRTRAGLDKWLKKTGLKLTGNSNYTVNGMITKGKPYELHGAFKVISFAGSGKMLEEFAKKHHMIAVDQMSNGDMTRAFVKHTKHGNVILEMNPNYPREVLPYYHE